jgi:hypothetical protein
MLQPIGVFAITTVCRPTTGLNVSGIPSLWPNGTQKRSRMKRPCAHFHIEWLHDHAPLISPKLLQCKNESLKGATVKILVHALAGLLG